MSLQKSLKKLSMALVVAAVMAMSVAPAFATTNLSLIGASPNQYRAELASISAYGLDPSLPVIMAFNDDLGTTIDAGDVAIQLNGTEVTYNADPMVSGNEMTLYPNLVSGNVYTVTFQDDLDGIASFSFKTKTGGTGGGIAVPYVVGKIVDGNLTGYSEGMVPTNQTFFFTFGNNISKEVNRDKIHLQKHIGDSTDIDKDNPSEWEDVAVNITFNANGARWNVAVAPTANLASNTVYHLFIDGSFVANNGITLGDGEVDEYFKTK